MADKERPTLAHGALPLRCETYPPLYPQRREVGHVERGTSTECPHHFQDENELGDDEEDDSEQPEHPDSSKPGDSGNTAQELSQADIIKQLLETMNTVKRQGEMLQRLMERHEVSSPGSSRSSSSSQQSRSPPLSQNYQDGPDQGQVGLLPGPPATCCGPADQASAQPTLFPLLPLHPQTRPPPLVRQPVSLHHPVSNQPVPSYHPASHSSRPSHHRSLYQSNSAPSLPATQSHLSVSYQPVTSHAPHSHPPPLHSPRGPVAPPVGRSRHYRPVEAPKFPDFTKEDEVQYRMLRIALTNLLDPEETEEFKFHVLLDHLKVDQARRLALAFSYAYQPFTEALRALDERYGQPRQLALKELKNIMALPPVRSGDGHALDAFALRVQALVGLLRTMDDQGNAELLCGSHVDRLLEKLSTEQVSRFKRHIYRSQLDFNYDLMHLSDWLQMESRCQPRRDYTGPSRSYRPLAPTHATTTVLHGANSTAERTDIQMPSRSPCAYCSSTSHHISQCVDFKVLNKQQVISWIKENKRCWRCARPHVAAKCTLNRDCNTCKRRHLQILCDINKKSDTSSYHVNSSANTLYLDRPSRTGHVLLKLVKVTLRNGNHTLETFALLDDGSERTILLQAAARRLQLDGEPENLALRTVRQGVEVLQGATVSFEVSSASASSGEFHIKHAFTADRLALSEHTHPVHSLQRKYKHLCGLPLTSMHHVTPLLLIGSDHNHLISPIAPVRFGPSGAPAAVKTCLGWTLQGPTRDIDLPLSTAKCFHISLAPQFTELYQNVERLWQLDVVPHRSERAVTRSKLDKQAVNLLETATKRVLVDGVYRYATPLLRISEGPPLNAPPQAVMARLRATESKLAKDPTKAAAYNTEVSKLVETGHVKRLAEGEVGTSPEAWYIPHHMVTHNAKNRLVFDCSFEYKGQNLNKILLPGPTLGPSLLGVLLRFREHEVAISGDIKSMFHQVRLLTRDKPLLRFLWRDMMKDTLPSVYEWQVLPFGTTCSPCCATFALQRHVESQTQPSDPVRQSVERAFYVDNCLQSFPTVAMARQTLDQLRSILSSGGFNIRQWASNDPMVISHLPSEAKSANSEFWLSKDTTPPTECTLGLQWNCQTDHLGYRGQATESSITTMRYIYHVLASLYDPLGYLIPYTTRAKVLIQRLWDKRREWDDPLLPSDLLLAWNAWKDELSILSAVTMPRCYTSRSIPPPSKQDLHIFCDASESAYGAVAYLRSEDDREQAQVSFLLARSRVAPKRQQSIPRLELCAALVGARLCDLLRVELTLPIRHTILWSDSTTVLAWLQADSCRFKVFVGTRVSEIQELTNCQDWRYVNTVNNPADDLTRGKTLAEIQQLNRWSQGPQFLYHPSNTWPQVPDSSKDGVDHQQLEMKPSFCGEVAMVGSLPDFSQYQTYQALLDASVELRTSPDAQLTPTAADYLQAEIENLRQAQKDSFGEDLVNLKAKRPLASTSRLLTLAPEVCPETGLIRVGGRLRQSEQEPDATHPIVLDPKHPLSKLLIQKYDERLKHPGPERVFAELRRRFWILRGREAIRKYQRGCVHCQRWRAKPVVPRMADLPIARLQLHKPAFYSTGMDCFGPYNVKLGRRTEKRWGIIFKCMTTRSVHLDLLCSLNTDSFLMALRRFTARRGTPFELWSDQGTNFKGGERELQEALTSLTLSLQPQLEKRRIRFHFNPPYAPHFGGSWEREIRSVKQALQGSLGAQLVTAEVLQTLLIEVENILNSKPLGYVSSDVADPDPVTPNLLLMGRRDSSLPLVSYPSSELLSRRQWRHSQVLADHFWSHFIKRYLPHLQGRQKWQRDKEDMPVSTVVMVMDPQLPRALWPVGRITRVLPSKDSRVRTAEVMVGNKSYVRSVSRLIKLPAIPDDPLDQSR